MTVFIMQVNTKLLIILSLIIIVVGFSLIWFGLRPLQAETDSVQVTASPATIQNSPTATGFATLTGLSGDQVLVTRVIDGDTVEIEGGKKIRLLGVDTPETVDPKRPVGCYGKEASDEMKSLLTSKTVILQKDVSETDKYGRLLRFIFLPIDNGNYLFVDDFLVREGYAKVLTIPPDKKYSDQFTQAQTEARNAKKGLWGKC